jgi:hypothetical protein
VWTVFAFMRRQPTPYRALPRTAYVNRPRKNSEEKRKLAILTEAAAFPVMERMVPNSAMIAKTIIHPSISCSLVLSPAYFGMQVKAHRGCLLFRTPGV